MVMIRSGVEGSSILLQDTIDSVDIGSEWRLRINERMREREEEVGGKAGVYERL